MNGSERARNLLLTKPSKKLPSSRQKETDFKSIRESQQLMEVKGCHRTLLCRQAFRKHSAGYSNVFVDSDSSRKKVSFEQHPDADRRTKKEKPSMVITLPTKSEKLATKGTQTDFRESETQTVPWKHEIQSGEKTLAELLSLNWFNLEKNFPPGVEEVMLIEKARQKLAWENVLDRLKGKCIEIKRKSLLLRMMDNETAWREKKKEEENQERLEMSMQQMTDSQKAFEEKLWIRLQRSYGCRQQENFSKINRWNHQLKRKIRQAKSAKERPAGKPDLISMHKDTTSDLYAPKLRNGKNISAWHEVIDIRCRYLKRFHVGCKASSAAEVEQEKLDRGEGLEILEKHMTEVLNPKLSPFPSKDLKSISKELQMSWKKFAEKEGEEPKGKKLASLSLKIALPVPTPELSTGRERLPSGSEENFHLSTLLFGKIGHSQGNT